MREILFRGKRIDNGKWVYGYYSKHSKTGKTFIRVTGKPCTGSYEVDPTTVSEFTNMVDEMGNKVFEGDICYASGATTEYSLFVIRVDGWGCFLDYYFGGEHFDTDQVKQNDWILDSKVIGNIHDNPELLKGEQ